MDNNDEPFHCHQCGICRVGGQDNFKHCTTCGMCIDKTIFANHNCQANKFMTTAKCPVCYEDLFSSRSPCHELPCNHSIHWHCFQELSSVDIRCPICKKIMIEQTDVDGVDIWFDLRMDIERQPLPPDQNKVVDIVCNDCDSRQCNRRWHPLGVSCEECRGYNTYIAIIKMVGVEAYSFLEEMNNRDEEKE